MNNINTWKGQRLEIPMNIDLQKAKVENSITNLSINTSKAHFKKSKVENLKILTLQKVNHIISICELWISTVKDQEVENLEDQRSNI